MVAPYYPAHAVEGADFEAKWCDHCLRRREADWEDEFGNHIEGDCPILSAASVYPVDEWVYRHGMPWCTAFEEDPDNPARCLFTQELPL